VAASKRGSVFIAVSFCWAESLRAIVGPAGCRVVF
jgi:hypothetical protein